MSALYPRNLDIDNVNPRVKAATYAVRGELTHKRQQDNSSPQILPVVQANIGNPQQLGQKPITFMRHVLSLLENPALLDHGELLALAGYRKDEIDRARWLLEQIGSVGAYSHSCGVPAIRKSVADHIRQRDEFDADEDHIYLTSGASAAIYAILTVICGSSTTGVLVPDPQYPLYAATLAILGARCVPFGLKESSAWAIDVSNIARAYDMADADGADVRAIVVINPGNPTGSLLSHVEMNNIIRFAAEKRLTIIADEVYQTNVFKGTFHSFKWAVRKLQQSDPEQFDHVQLVSLNSTSKGVIGECGHRAGYFEVVGFDQNVRDQISKLLSLSLCPPVIGQCLLDLMVKPPTEGDPSHELYSCEVNFIREQLRQRASELYEAFRGMENVEVQEPLVDCSGALLPKSHLLTIRCRLLFTCFQPLTCLCEL